MKLKKIDFQKAKWLIPVLSFLVIFESVLIVRKLVDRKVYLVKTVELGEEKAVSLSFSGEQQLVAGQEGEFLVVMRVLKDVALDGLDILVEYNPDQVEIVNVEPASKFSYLARNWVQPEKNRILVSMVESAKPDGVEFSAGEETVMMSVRYLAKNSGQTKFSIFKSEEGAGTVLAENGTARRVPFTTKDFTVQAR